MKKRFFSVILCIAIFISIIPSTAFAATTRNISFEETLAADLKELGLFKGVSKTTFDLNREPSRAEALVMLIRVLGKENEALNGSWSHPFTDVPSGQIHMSDTLMKMDLQMECLALYLAQERPALVCISLLF
jgi:hypothetical protein